jgi:competence protein ComEA
MFDHFRRRGAGRGQRASDRLTMLAANAPLPDPRPRLSTVAEDGADGEWALIDESAPDAESDHARGGAGALVEHWLPGGVRVWSPRRRLLAVLLTTVVVAICVAIAVLTARPDRESPPDLPAPNAVRRGLAPAGGSIVVSVVGRVARPGLATLPEGARVNDAVHAAGGVDQGVDLSGLNLARRLTDGEQIYVGVPAPPPDDGVQAQSGRPAKIDLNTASVADLDGLPGVGQVTAQRIVQWRKQRGRFIAVEQLREIDGIGATRFARLKDLVMVR